MRPIRAIFYSLDQWSRMTVRSGGRAAIRRMRSIYQAFIAPIAIHLGGTSELGLTDSRARANVIDAKRESPSMPCHASTHPRHRRRYLYYTSADPPSCFLNVLPILFTSLATSKRTFPLTKPCTNTYDCYINANCSFCRLERLIEPVSWIGDIAGRSLA